MRGGSQSAAGCPGQLPPLEVPCAVGVAATLHQALTFYRPFPHNEKQRQLHSCWFGGLGFTLSNLVQPLREPSFSNVAAPWSREEFCTFSGDLLLPGPGMSCPRRLQAPRELQVGAMATRAAVEVWGRGRTHPILLTGDGVLRAWGAVVT